MKVSFTCAHCGASLQIDESLVGTDVLCPICRKATHASASPPVSGESPLTSGSPFQDDYPQQDDISANPYASPACLPDRDAIPELEGNLDMQPATVRFGRLFYETLRFAFKNYGVFIIWGVIQLLVGMGTMHLFGVPYVQAGPMPGQPATMPDIGALLTVSLFGMVLWIFFSRYLIQICVTGRTWALAHFKLKPSLFLNVIGGSLMFFVYLVMAYIALVVGIILPLVLIGIGRFAVPENSVASTVLGVGVGIGIVIWVVVLVVAVLRYLFTRSFFLCFILDKEVGVKQAFSFSRKYTDKNFDTFVLGCLCMIPILAPAGTVAYLNSIGVIEADAFQVGLFGSLFNLFLVFPITQSYITVFYFLMTDRTPARSPRTAPISGTEENAMTHAPLTYNADTNGDTNAEENAS